MASTDKNIVKLNCELIPRASCILRSLFRSTWNKITGKPWRNTPEGGKDFISQFGKNIWISANYRQKDRLESGNIDTWDLKLLNHVLQKLKLKNNLKLQIRALYDIVNDILRNNGILTDDEFVRIEEMVKGLESLGYDVIEYLEKLNLEDEYEKNLNELLAGDFLKAARAFCEQKNHSAAIKAYTEAIKLIRISKEVLGKLYLNRSQVYLMEKSVDNEVLFLFKTQNNTISSLEDAKRAVVLLPGCSEAYSQLACSYFALNKYSKALKCINISSELDKLPANAAEMRKECEKIIADMKIAGTETYYAEKLPTNEAELVAEFNKRSGMNMTVGMSLKMEKSLKDMKDPNATVWQAHRCMMGFDCEKNCKLGVELYEEAAQQGNVEAMYNLGVIYREGKFVEKDLKKSLTYLNKAVEVNIGKTGYKPVGMREAQFELGFMHQKGIGLSRDYEKAVQLFMKSSENGNKHAASLLGQFYFNGNCVEKDIEKAVQFWMLAAERYDVIAMQTLAEYYLGHDVDPDQALKWHFQAIEAGNLIAEKKSKEFTAMAEKIDREIGSVDEEMIRWEKKNGYFGLGDLMKKRRLRYRENKLPGSTKFGEYLSNLRTGECLPMDFKKCEKNALTLDLIEEFIAKGSSYALELKKALLHFENGKNYLMSLDRLCWRIIVHELAESFRITEKIVSWDYLTHLKAIELVSWARRLKGNTGQIDKDLRVCYATLNANSINQVINNLEESVKLYPNDIWFLQALCAILGFKYDHERGLQMAERGLAKEPNNLELLYLRAAHLRNLQVRDKGKVIEAHEKFLEVAPPDHIKVPEVYYTLAFEHVMFAGGRERLMGNQMKRQTLELVAKYYSLGLEAEKLLIPFFVRQHCDQKTFLDQMMALKPFRMAVEKQQVMTGGVKVDVKAEHKQKKEKKRGNGEENKPKKDEKKESSDEIDAERLKKLTNPRREAIIRDHREVIYNMNRQLGSGKDSFTTRLTFKPKLKQKAPPQLAEVKSITLRDMDLFKEHVYKGFELKCVVIDEPTLGFSGVGIVVEDENGDVERVCVYNIEQDEEVHNKIGYGCQITILNPYFKIAMDQKQLIRVDDVESVIFDAGPDLSRCRYCGKIGAVKKCGRCLKACYCSKECQERDWKVLRHKFICKNV